MMKRLICQSLGCSLLGWGVAATAADAIPGQSLKNAEAWIQAHPTLRPTPREVLRVHRVDTPARRFTFSASVFPVTGLSAEMPELADQIRTERITLVNLVEGVTSERLEESLRAIYDATIYNDYRRAQVVYRYPGEVLGRDGVTGGRVGELKLGDRFGYWLELVASPDGFASSGTLAVFLREDVLALQAQLENRHSNNPTPFP